MLQQKGRIQFNTVKYGRDKHLQADALGIEEHEETEEVASIWGLSFDILQLGGKCRRILSIG
jgi:hypothetical protein